MSLFCCLCCLFLFPLIGCQKSSVPQLIPSITPTYTATPLIGVSFATLAPPTVAVLQTTPTPLPPPTVTPTPTPIFYEVVTGDTIWVIAAKSYRTVEEVLALNPNVRPESLQIGQLLQLPPPATPVFQTAGTTPMPIQVTVLSLASYRTPLDGLWFLGEVINEGEMPAQNLQLAIDLLDSNGQTIQTLLAWVATPILPAHERAPFGVLLPQIPTDFAHTRVTIIGGESLVDMGDHTLDLAVNVTSANIEETYIFLEGELVNETTPTSTTMPGTTQNIWLTATFYNPQGQVTGYTQQTFTTPLAIGQSHPFYLTVSPPGGRITTYHITVQGQLRTEDS